MGVKGTVVAAISLVSAGTAGNFLFSSRAPAVAEMEVSVPGGITPNPESSRRPAGAAPRAPAFPARVPYSSPAGDGIDSSSQAEGATNAATAAPPGSGGASAVSGTNNAIVSNGAQSEPAKDPAKKDSSADPAKSDAAAQPAGGGLGTSSTDTSTATSTATTVATSAPVSLGLTVSATGWLNLCQIVSLTVLDDGGNQTASNSNYRVSVTASAGTLYTDAICSTPATVGDILLTPGSYGTTRYFKSSAAVSATISASTPGLASASSVVTVGTPAATIELGQPNMTSGVADNGGETAKALSLPYNPWITGTHLLVSDEANNRVLIWNTLPTTSGRAADLVLGQAGFGTAGTGVTASTMNTPDHVSSDGTHVFVADSANNRVLIWKTFPTSSGQAADIVLGQPDMVTNTDTNGGPSAKSLSYPECAYTDGVHLFVCDANNSRILIWKTIPTSNFAPADLVVGQPDMVSINSGTTASSMNYPTHVTVSGGKLFVTDRGNNRVLIWNSLPTANGQAASVVVGQPDFVSSVANNGGIGAATLNAPGATRVDGQNRLLVADFQNNRVLIWDQVPTQSGASADAVIGQPSMTASAANNGGLSASSLSVPYGMCVNGSDLWLADQTNHRVLKYGLP